MKAIDHPHVRVNFDTGNITYYNRDRNAVDELEKIIDYVGTVELKDHNGAFETWVFPPLGQGVVDFKGVLRILIDHGYSGPVTLEFEGTKGVELDEAGTKRAIEQSIAYIRSIGNFA
jgi:inosose dehydratase